jgi:hypothetical protein
MALNFASVRVAALSGIATFLSTTCVTTSPLRMKLRAGRLDVGDANAAGKSGRVYRWARAADRIVTETVAAGERHGVDAVEDALTPRAAVCQSVITLLVRPLTHLSPHAL